MTSASAATSRNHDGSHGHGERIASTSSTSTSSGGGGKDADADQQKGGADATSRKRSRSLSKAKRKDGARETTRHESLGGAIVRALIGSLAFLFKRPVRLFRPVKLSSWTILEAMAKREGRTFGLRYIRSVIKRENRSFLPHLLGPPLLVNTAIGFTLFEAYSLTESKLLSDRKKRIQQAPHAGEDDAAGSGDDPALATHDQGATWTPLWIVTVSGAAAGAAQCFLSAPLDNVRYILQRNVGAGAANKVHRSVPRQIKEISWRAVLRAAVLPFAPAVARDKLVADMHKAAAASETKANDARGQKMSAAETRKLWETRLKRWRGGIHGSGLFLSLIRDSVGFGSFFFIFECSRRCAYYSSTSIDKAFAWINARGLGRVRRSGDDLDDEGSGAPMRSDGHGDVHIEGSMRDWIREGQRDVTDADLSYNKSRTVQGRVVAVIILLIGGAIGALSYELVGRPFELMRVVIWEGRKEWEQDMRKEQRRYASARTSSRGRRSAGAAAAIDDVDLAPQGGRSAIIGGRVSASQAAFRLGANGRLGNLVALRAQNSGGSTTSHLTTYTMLRRPAHPLRLVNAAARRLAGAPVRTAAVKRRASARPSSKPRIRLATSRSHKHGGVAASSHDPSKNATQPNDSATPTPTPPTPQRPFRPRPSLATRPSSLSLLVEHARKIAKVDQRFGGPDPATTSTPLLLYHTYFVAPFLPAIPHAMVDNEMMRGLAASEAEDGGKQGQRRGTIAAASDASEARGPIDTSQITTMAQRTLLMSIASRRRDAFRPEEKLRKSWIRNNPVNSSLAASSSSSGGSLRPSTANASAGTGTGAGAAPSGSVLKNGVRNWGHGRVAWALKRLATPYGVAFLVFAWMGGDLS
ncbi:uncharacterized protein PFL1_06422 [Pseudozyma flocculosa PF-1]|uniref:Mitochondrial carrier protein n=2 Tax=Pseudozyma flocculosa TaxID=84751 RepID=A0A5C3ETP6_9BASI|nr:uncharacterized protein PFL1_06422 [Pseudozyma flocculosa PF-1]EPQ25967.1 hypothetical protein PFL1_06422 [Pseudozyma flocculosa PF-1]SPO35733.1 uncharacterized protein PSFLO_01204 [Pseudozyma flocculosa]